MLALLLRITAIIVFVTICLEALDMGLFAQFTAQLPQHADLRPVLEGQAWRAIALSGLSYIAAGLIAYTLLRRRWGALRAMVALVLLTAVAIAAVIWSWRDVQPNLHAFEQGGRPLRYVKDWYYHLGKIDIDRIAKSKADLLVIDFARNDGRIPLTRAQVSQVAKRTDGGQRPVIAYLSIGEAEGYRFYWQLQWETNKPAWHLAENCAWPRNHLVRFWHDDWKRIIYKGPQSYLKRIIEAGFDGVYLDRVDVYSEVTKERPSARADMIAFVADLAKTARAIKPNFFIIAQNAEDLLRDRAYRRLIDGLGKEDLLFGHNGTGQRNSRYRIWKSTRLLRKLQWDFKPIFAVEYLTSKAAMREARSEMRQLNLVPTFAHRDLDGLDPTIDRPPSVELYGTPEWIAKECTAKGKRHW